MTARHKSILLWGTSIALLLIAFLPTAHAIDNKQISFIGARYDIFLYNSDVGSTVISFEENMSLVIDAYDGFGLYLPIGPIFLGLYWAPNYHDEDDLILFFDGLVLADFIFGWGLALPNYTYKGIFLFFGYEKY